MRIPVTLVAGYLGAGKTTLVNHLLREARGIRIAVLVNDFGDLPIDAELIEGQSGEVLTLAGGCICCSYGSDLMATLATLHEMPEAPQHILIEASGVALPGSIASAVGLIATLRLSAIVVLVDAGQIQRRATAAYVADTVLAQLAAADIVVVNKCDEISASQRAAVCDWLREAAPRALQLTTEQAEVPFDALIDRNRTREEKQARSLEVESALSHAEEDHAKRYFTHTLSWQLRPSLETVRQTLRTNAPGLLRAKGLVNCATAGWQEIQMVGNRLSITPREDNASFLYDDGTGHGALVVIGLRENFDRDALNKFAIELDADYN